MNAAFSGVFLPDAEVLLDVDLFHAVERHNVKFAHGFIVLGRISGRHDHPSCRELLIAERFALQKNWSIIGVSVSEMQLISSRNRMPSETPVRSISR